MTGKRLPVERYADHADEVPETNWPDREVWARIRETLYSLPSYFRMEGSMPSIPAADLHSANTLLGTAIEDHIPISLNQLRTTWDPLSKYADCLFKRQPQTFPDVPFVRETEQGSTILFGIEIKSWFVLAKEEEPSFRFYVNRRFCHPADLCVVYPWAFNAAISGSPRLFRPLVLSARKAARLRNEAWIHKAKDAAWKDIAEPTGKPTYHPDRGDRINDSSPIDKGNNMGRIARSGVWTVEIERLMRNERIAGIRFSDGNYFCRPSRKARHSKPQQIRSGPSPIN